MNVEWERGRESLCTKRSGFEFPFQIQQIYLYIFLSPVSVLLPPVQFLRSHVISGRTVRKSFHLFPVTVGFFFCCYCMTPPSSLQHTDRKRDPNKKIYLTFAVHFVVSSSLSSSLPAFSLSSYTRFLWWVCFLFPLFFPSPNVRSSPVKCCRK